MKQIDEYFKLQKEIYSYFGYVEDWCVFPIYDSRDCFWRIEGGDVYFSESEEALKEETGEFYSNSIFHQRFLPKAIYEGEDYTMIVVNTHCDGNKFLQIFKNSLRRN